MSWARVAPVVLLFAVLAGCGSSAADREAVTAAERTETGGRSTDEFIEETLIVPKTGWRTDFTKHTVPLLQFVSGGPGKDGVPAIDEPAYVSVEEAGGWLEPGEPVLEVELNGRVRGYPVQILIWHEVVNDTLAGTPVVVTFCPLCNTALVFERTVGDRVLDFGTTGVLRNSDLVMYDRETESWWQQFGGDAVVGELAGAKLPQLPATIVPWEDFAARNPDGDVLSRDTGFERPYGARPYIGYDEPGSQTVVGTKNQGDDRLPLKERVVFVERGEEALVVPFTALEQAGRVEVEVGGDALEVEWIPGVRSPFGSTDDATEGREVGSALVRLSSTGETVAFDTPFWFAIAAFRPDARIWSAGG